MDLESDCSALESVEDNGIIQESSPHGENGEEVRNGSCLDEAEKLVSTREEADRVPSDKDEKSVEPAKPVNFGSSEEAKSPVGTTHPTSKGHGLRKWRRIRREMVKDQSAHLDNSKILKRGLSGASNPPPAKPLHFPSAEIQQNSEGSVGSVNLTRNTGDGFALSGIGPDSRFAIGHAFSAGTDSENSEDQSSKSSTAASAPKFRYDLPTAMGNAWDNKHRVKNLGAKSVGISTQRAQQGKSWVENTKKPRGERVKIEKENSHSSMESDSRSSNFFFMQGAFSVSNNGKQGGKMMNDDGENSVEAQGREQTAYYRKENLGEEADDLSQEDSAADVSVNNNHCSSADLDPLAESINGLLCVQEALEKEVQKFQDIGKAPASLHHDTDKGSRVHADSLSTDPQRGEPSSSSVTLESQILSLTHIVKNLESKLEEATNMLEMKESRIGELKAALSFSKSAGEETGSTLELQQERYRETETELEDLFQQKIKAEIEYLTLTRSIENLKVSVEDQVKLFEEQRALAGEQVQVLDKLGQAQSKAAVLKKQAKELEKNCGDILGMEGVLNMQRKACKVTSCFFIQLILLVLVFWLFISQLFPDSGMVVPT